MEKKESLEKEERKRERERNFKVGEDWTKEGSGLSLAPNRRKMHHTHHSSKLARLASQNPQLQ